MKRFRLNPDVPVLALLDAELPKDFSYVLPSDEDYLYMIGVSIARRHMIGVSIARRLARGMTSLGELLEGENVDSYCWRLSIDALNRLVSRGWVLAEEDAEALAIIDESLRRQREVRVPATTAA